MTTRPRRSALYMPGANPRALEKARTLGADVLLLDLEDSVAPDAKELARAQVVAAIAAGGYGHRELVIRSNGLDTPWGHADLVAAATSGADAVLIPKVDSAEGVRMADRVLRAAGAPESLRLWVMMETPRAMLAAADIAGACPRLECLVMGTSDLTKDLGALNTQDRLPMITGLGLTLLAARAFGLAVLDGVHVDLEDEAGFAAACRQGRELGFDGKTLIHPKQLAAANSAFAPTTDELTRARRIIAAHAEAVAAGKGVTLVDGKLVEALHVETARRTVALGEAVAARG
ncbi:MULTISPECIES: CoA ester lyase [unclassified Azospirillum]|uniref:HpcH/HpaI aldolase/citrate lyase family protein n=1 Tax=unclassified Azospirillum TaxID=2630922 RepID=UPI000B6ECA1F|nr:MULTISPECIES: CoA ester lyase [unclassified Azospirillum]SNR98064.1 citrate lyase subunit beta / citryl-CoA lyase [Azospirillum sp. RU38E]SNS15237.1 citrate lyase subunit beta / citryl-CoA lyase [Azospirillum sp. RU37A]